MQVIPETTKERESTDYCVQPGSHCHICSLVNYGRDCRNNPVVHETDCKHEQCADN